MPARAIEDEHDLLAGTGPRLARKLRQLHLEEGNTDCRGQMKEGPTRGGMDTADQVTPGEAMLHDRRGPLPNGRPDAPEQRFEANAMFVGGP